MTKEQYERAADFWTRRDAGERKMDAAALYARIDGFLKSHKVLALATGGESFIRCTPLEYGWHGGALWIFSEGGLKFKALKVNKHVAAAVFETDLGFGKLKSLQIEGTAELIEPMSEEYLEAAAFKNISTKFLERLKEPLWLIRITPSEITCLDTDLKKAGFGRRQIWRAGR